MIKVGSNVLTRNDGKLNVTRMSAIVDQVVWLRRQGYEVILVSSGAVAAGRAELSVQHKLDSVEQRQLFSAIGQVKLTGLYYDLFREYGIRIGQVLTMKENFASRREYLNQRACMGVMLDNGVVPIVNENDTVSVTELMFTDNDELSGLIATMMGGTTAHHSEQYRWHLYRQSGPPAVEAHPNGGTWARPKRIYTTREKPAGTWRHDHQV